MPSKAFRSYFFRSHLFRSSFSLLLLATLSSCQPTVTPEVTVEKDASETTLDNIQKEPKASADKTDSAESGDRTADEGQMIDGVTIPDTILSTLSPGEHCYTSDTEVEKINVRFSIDTTDHVTGNVQGSIRDKASSQSGDQYTDYHQTLDGTIDGSNLNLDVATWIEYNRQNQQATWKVSEKTLEIDNNILSQADCQIVSKVFQNEEGLEARDLISINNKGTRKQIYFEPGKSNTTVSDSVLESYQDIYSITAQGGQQLSLSLSSENDNAAFYVVTPSSFILGTRLKQETFSLPQTGDYQIIVSANQENATYDLEVLLE